MRQAVSALAAMAAAGLLVSCGEVETSVAAPVSGDEAQTIERPVPDVPEGNYVEQIVPANGAALTIETGLLVTSVAAIPATAHLGQSHIVAAHPGGVIVYNTAGDLVWQDDTPAILVAHYQNQLVVYREIDGETVLDRYGIDFPSTPVLADSSSPSPIAATTLQRSAFASLGPVRIDGSNIIIGDKTVELDAPVSAVASATYFPPVVAGKALVIATESGVITARPAKGL